MQTMPKLALGPIAMLDQAICAHVRLYQGAMPRRFEMHPAVFVDVKSALLDRYAWMRSLDQPLVYRNVPIIADRLASRPKLITCRNEVEYL